jgi:sarcosine oxidase, subunit beta
MTMTSDSLSVNTAVIGGGIAGAATAYYLAVGGADGVAIFERDQMASGVTAASFSGIRQQFSTAPEIELSKRGLAFWKTCEEKFDSPCPFHQVGYLFLTGRPELLEKFADAARLQQELDAGPVEMLDPAGVVRVAPWIASDGLVGGCYTPADGRVTATDGVEALAKGARRLGVEIRRHWPVTGLERAADGGYIMTGPTGRVQANQVVVAAGIWSPELLAPLGFQLDIYPMRTHYALTGAALTGEVVPLTVDFDTGFCIEPEGPGLAVTMLLPELPVGYTQQDMLQDWYEAAATRAPGLVDLGISHLLTATADGVTDGHPNAGQLDDNLWVIAGFAGHGAMHGPPTAELMARTMLGDPDPIIDISAFSPLRNRSSGEEWMVAQKKD